MRRFQESTKRGEAWTRRRKKSLNEKIERRKRYIEDIRNFRESIIHYSTELTNLKNKIEYEAVGVRDGVNVKVVVQPEGEGIITAFPLE